MKDSASLFVEIGSTEKYSLSLPRHLVTTLILLPFFYWYKKGRDELKLFKPITQRKNVPTTIDLTVRLFVHCPLLFFLFFYFIHTLFSWPLCCLAGNIGSRGNKSQPPIVQWTPRFLPLSTNRISHTHEWRRLLFYLFQTRWKQILDRIKNTWWRNTETWIKQRYDLTLEKKKRKCLSLMANNKVIWLDVHSLSCLDMHTK